MPETSHNFITHAPGLVTLAPAGAAFREHLRKYFQAQINASAHYASVFQQLGLDATDDPFDILAELPPTTKETYRNILQLEALTRLNESTFVTDYSSGSTAENVLRLCAPADDLAEQALTETAFAAAGLGPADHFICMDIGATEIYDFYFRAARSLGVRRCSFVHLTHKYAAACQPLTALRPTVLLTVPSLLVRAWPVLREFWLGERSPIRTVIHMGEAMPAAFRREVEEHWQCEIRSFYGTTETGGIGIDCEQKDGIHLDPAAVLPTLESARQTGPTEYEGEVLLTTLHVRNQSVIKYRVGDRVRLETAPCPCGNRLPRLRFLERTHEAFMIAGEKFHHAMILEELRETAPDLPFARLVIEDLEAGQGDALLRVQLPESFQKYKSDFLNTLKTDIFELDALIRYGLVKLRLEFLPLNLFQGRKLLKVRDERLHLGQNPAGSQPN